MAMTKYASLEHAQVLGLKGSKERVRTASLSKIGDFEDYRTDDGYLYARIRAISSRVNKNHDGWPAVELAGGPEIFDHHLATEGGFTIEADSHNQYGYSTFLGKPIFVDHHNSDPSRARGVIVDAKLHVDDHKTASLDPYYSSDQVDHEHLPGTWVELLLEVDAKAFPRLAKAIIAGSKDPGKGIDGFSMGCDVEKSICNICKNAATSPDDYCNHIRMKGAEFPFINSKTGRKESRKSYENCYGIKFFEISAVFDPADETALLREVTANGPGKGMKPVACPDCMDQFPGTPCATCGGVGFAHAQPNGDGVWMHGDLTPDYVTHETPGLSGREPLLGKVAGPISCPDCQYKYNSKDCDLCQGKGFLHVPVEEGSPVPGDGYRYPYRDVSNLPPSELFQSMKPNYGKAASDNLTKPCSECHSHTTGTNDAGESYCHSCGHTWSSGELHESSWKVDVPRREAGGPSMAPNAPAGNGATSAPSAAPSVPQTQGTCPTCGRPKPCPCDIGMNQPGGVTPNGVMPGGVSAKTADHPVPQADLLHAPEVVDTLRDEIVCPICGSNMDEEKCDVCGYVEPPDGFDNPDLEKSKENVQEREQEKQQEETPGADLPDGALGPNAPDAGEAPVIPQSVSHVKSMETSRVAATNPDEETPVITNAGPVSDEPTREVVISDQTTPVTSSVRTAHDFIVAAAGANRRTSMKHTADAASGAPAIATPDKRTDVEGVGGVLDASNESASQADAQVDVLGIGGTGVEGVDAEAHKELPVDSSDNAGFDKKKNVEAIPTKTFDDGSSGVERQADPVSREPWPASADGVKAAAWIVQGHDDEVFPDGGDGLSGGPAVQGVEPVDPIGKAQDRVNVLDHVTSPSNNSGPTTTWTGTDGNGVLRQQEPVTNDSIARGEINGDNGANWTSSTHLFAAMKLADLEVELGLLNADKKFERIAGLERVSRDALVAELGYAQRLKTAGIVNKKVAGVGRVPSLAQPPVAKEASTVSDDQIPDEALFS